ncbi:uncharacterized protein LOC123266459 [Cotesia glomerata]|uniref:uncharacterized protein LOC123266459 n=1 Tax=Cotesia glomerata TaxID=32391 RepID=UPI001D02666E|nr:uncharacterized protein LOC123266459 [Cotesia glomerata]
MTRYKQWTSKYFRIIIGCILGFVLFCTSFKRIKLLRTYKFQSSIADIIDLEIKYMPNEIYPESDHWVSVQSLNGHIYSAYLDMRPEVIVNSNYNSYMNIVWATIRVIAILPFDTKSDEVVCVFKLESKDRELFYKKVTASEVKFFDDNWKLKYSSAFITCDLTHVSYYNYDIFYEKQQLPQSVGIIRKNADNSSLQFVDINYPPNGISQMDRPSDKFMALCVPVLHHEFDRPLELIEFIEYYRLMGVSRFVFYNSSVSEDVSKVLKFYHAEQYDLVKIQQWNLPALYIYEKTLRLEGLYGALNDCLYRNSLHNYFRYVGVFDVDEFLIPKVHNNFTGLMKNLDLSEENYGYVSFLFRHVYFYTMYPDVKENSTGKKDPYLFTSAKIQRLRDPHPAGVKSRYIIRARDAVEIGNYKSTKLLKDASGEMIVKPDVALLHHYAPCEAEEMGCYLKTVEIDRTALRFTSELARNVAKACREIFSNHKCPSPKKRMPGELNS